MSTFTSKKLLDLWSQNKVTTEMTVGHLAQNNLRQDQEYLEMIKMIAQVHTILHEFLLRAEEENWGGKRP